MQYYICRLYMWLHTNIIYIISYVVNITYLSRRKRPYIYVFISATFGNKNIVLLFTLGIYADHDVVDADDDDDLRWDVEEGIAWHRITALAYA